MSYYSKCTSIIPLYKNQHTLYACQISIHTLQYTVGDIVCLSQCLEATTTFINSTCSKAMLDGTYHSVSTILQSYPFTKISTPLMPIKHQIFNIHSVIYTFGNIACLSQCLETTTTLIKIINYMR